MFLRRAYYLLDRVLRYLENAAVVLAGAIMLVAMVLVTCDAAFRYLFRAPLAFQYHLTENYLLIALITLSLAWGYRTAGYIRITSLIKALPPIAAQVVLRLGLFVSAIYISVLAWRGGEYFLYAYQTDQVQMGIIDWPVDWSWIWIPVGCGLLAMRLFLLCVGPVSELHHEHKEEAEI